MKIYLLSSEHFFAGETKLVSELLKRYANDLVFHLRKPAASRHDYCSFLKQIPRSQHRRIMLHGAYELQEDFELRGLHFSTANRWMKASYRNAFCSSSAHSIAELKELDGQFEQLFISPIFPSISKPRYRGDINLADLSTYLRQARSSRVIALGGISASNIGALKDMGFDGLAVLGSVWGTAPIDEQQVMERMKRIVNEELV